MELIDAASVAATFTADIPDLVWATGPISYEYHFAERALFDSMVTSSWGLDGSLFDADTTTLAVDGDRLLGILIAMPGNEFRDRRAGLAPVWRQLLADGEIDEPTINGIVERSERASWLNPALHPDTYYVHALAVPPEARGTGVGYRLMRHALSVGAEAGFRRVQLDVLSDNPAVSFYESVGLEVLAETRAPDPTAFGVPPEYRMGIAL